jgi:poly(A) polymerase
LGIVEPARKITPEAWMTQSETRQIMRALQADGIPARFVGGCVRDTLLGRPVKDIDIATAETPDRVVALIEKAGYRAIPTGISHGTVTAVVAGKPFEITTLRHDVETDGRRARVAFTDDWAADAERRDFTFNAIFCDEDGTIYDPTGGLADLEAGCVRFVGTALERIREDVLRLMRFFRLYAYYGTAAPDAEALEACRTMAPEVVTLSAERVWGELRRLLQAPDPVPVLDLMERWSVLPHVLPEADSRERLARLVDFERHAGTQADDIRRLAAVVKTDADGAAALAGRLRLSNAESRRLVALVAPSEQPSVGLGERQNRVLLYRVGPDNFADLVLLGWAGDDRDGDTDRVRTDAWRDLMSLPERAPVPAFPLSGKDVLALGVPTGAKVGELLEAAEDWWIGQNFVPDQAACLAWLSQRL